MRVWPSKYQNSLQQLLAKWDDEVMRKAALFVFMHGGIASGIKLGEHIGISPRGLRQKLTKGGLFLAEYRGPEKGRASVWYRINPAHMPPPVAPPPLRACLPAPEEPANA